MNIIHLPRILWLHVENGGLKCGYMNRSPSAKELIVVKYIFIGLIKFYQKAISPLKPRTCRFYPTCSEYGLEAFKRFGALKGAYLTIIRIGKCHPFHRGGVDLVPEKKKNHDLQKHT